MNKMNSPRSKLRGITSASLRYADNKDFFLICYSSHAPRSGEFQVKALKKNPNHPLDFHDHSLKGAVTTITGKPIKYPPSDPRSKPVRDEIIKKFERASKLVILIGKDTHKSDWVVWEVNTFIQMKNPFSGEKTWKRVRGMKLKGCDDAKMPDALMNGRSTKEMIWDPEALDRWLDQDPDA